MAPRAFAAGPDAAARALDKKAMEEDYLATDFDKAQDKLNKAVAMCEGKCSPQTRALLHRDLGVVLVGGLNDKDKGTAQFVQALVADPKIALDPDVKTKEIEAAFADAKKKAAKGGGGGGGAGGGGGGGEPSGDFTHTPVAEQQIRTPVPIYVEYGGTETIVKVMVRYKGFGMTEWKPLELQKVGNGWGANVPCADVAQQGSLQYYIQGFNADNDPVATAGDRNNPYSVPLKAKIDGEAPHLPGQAAPTQCADTGDCPPGFPCAKKGGGGEVSGGGEPDTGDKAEGAECEEGNECKSGKCENSKCTAPADKTPYSKIWIGAGGGIDLIFVGSGNDVCKLDDKTAVPITDGFYCTNSDGSDYPSRDDKGAQNKGLAAGKAGSINGGPALGNIRAWLSFDYGVTPNILIGGRLGLALKGYPGSASQQDGHSHITPVHVEGRFTYLFGKMALANKFAPYAFGAVGASEWDAEVDVPVNEAGTNKTVQAWQSAGPFFVSVGGGIRFAPVPRRFAIMLSPLKLNLAFGGTGTFLPSLQPELGLQVGF